MYFPFFPFSSLNSNTRIYNIMNKTNIFSQTSNVLKKNDSSPNVSICGTYGGPILPCRNRRYHMQGIFCFSRNHAFQIVFLYRLCTFPKLSNDIWHSYVVLLLVTKLSLIVKTCGCLNFTKNVGDNGPDSLWATKMNRFKCEIWSSRR